MLRPNETYHTVAISQTQSSGNDCGHYSVRTGHFLTANIVTLSLLGTDQIQASNTNI